MCDICIPFRVPNFASHFNRVEIFRKDFSTLPLILSASKYFRYIFQLGLSFYLQISLKHGGGQWLVVTLKQTLVLTPVGVHHSHRMEAEDFQHELLTFVLALLLQSTISCYKVSSLSTKFHLFLQSSISCNKVPFLAIKFHFLLQSSNIRYKVQFLNINTKFQMISSCPG